MGFERLFVFVTVLPGIFFFIQYCNNKDRLDLANPKFQFLFGWLFYGFAVPLDYVFGFKIIQPWEVIDYSQEKHFNGMLIVILLFYTTLIGFLLTYKEPKVIQHHKKSQNMNFVTLPFIVIAAAIFIYFIYNLNEIMTLSRMDRSLQLENVGYRLIKFVETILIATSSIFILYNKNIKNVHYLTIILILLGGAQGDRSSIIIPIFAWLLRFRPTIKPRTFLVIGAAGILFLFIWKALYNITLAYILGKDVDFYDIVQTFSISIIDPVSPFNLATWVITDWGISDIYSGYTIFVLPILRTLPRFIFEFDFPTLGEQFMALYLPHIAAKGGGRGFGIVTEFYLNFYYAGPFLFGILWGLISRMLNNHHSLILSFLFIMCNFRIFRSDVASVFKTYFIIYGGIFLAWYIISLIIKVGMSEKSDYSFK